MRERCNNRNSAMGEQDHGNHLIAEALQTAAQGMKKQEHHAAHTAKIVLISYESLMAYQEVYLLRIYKELGINSTFVPMLQDGNAHYIQKEILK